MITKIIHINTKEPVTTIPLREYATHQTVHIKHLYIDCEEFIKQILESYKDSSEDLILLVARFIVPESRPSWIGKLLWEDYKENNKNRWGFKVINPKLFGGLK